jgi:putative PIN family toxin of toxin-antitoxin system
VIEAVLDANVIASGVLGLRSPTRTPGLVLRGWRQRRFQLFTSEHLIDEVRRTLNKPFFARRMEPDEVAATLTSLRDDAVLVPVVVVDHGVATHPEDDIVLATAVTAGVDDLVTGDGQPLGLGAYRSVAVVSPRVFLALLDGSEQREDGEDRG